MRPPTPNSTLCTWNVSSPVQWNESLAGSESPLAFLIHVNLKVGPTYYNLPEDEKLHTMKGGEADVGSVVA